MICVVVKLLRAILSTVLTTKHINKNGDYKMLVVLDQNTVENQISF